MNLKIIAFTIVTASTLSACMSGGVASAPVNAFTQLGVAGNGAISFGYSAASESSTACQILISEANGVFYSDSSFSYNYNVNNSSAQLCDGNNQNCLNSNNGNTPCISGTQILNGVSTQVVWNNCSYNANLQSFTAELTVSNNEQTCNGTVAGQAISLKAQAHSWPTNSKNN